MIGVGTALAVQVMVVAFVTFTVNLAPFWGELILGATVLPR